MFCPHCLFDIALTPRIWKRHPWELSRIGLEDLVADILSANARFEFSVTIAVGRNVREGAFTIDLGKPVMIQELMR